jgi:diguanylate cyclase (GGDEF)-like protein
MTGQSDKALALEALQEGAQDYLEKNHLTSYWLTRAIVYAIERHRLMEELHASTLVDDLTGLSNRRGFFVLAEQQLKFVRRMQNKLIVMYADLDGLKQINDTFGHQEGDRALVQLSQIFRRSFRDSDILARIGGDEFALFAADSACEDIQVLPSRLQKNLEEYNSSNRVPYKLSISIGTVCLDFVNHSSLDELLNRADHAMYENKQGKRHER